MAQYGDKVFDAEPIDQIELFSSHILTAMFDHHKKAEPKLKEIITRIKPDLIAVDCYICSPAATNSGIPWVRMFSAGPLAVLFGAENGKSSRASMFLMKILPKSILKFLIKNSIAKNLKLPPPNSGKI